MAHKKRSAGNELTHDNWQDEEEPEEAGVFKKANEDVLKNRPKLTAKRRGIGEAGKTSAFAGFGGFGSLKTATSSSPFSFLANVTSTSTATSISSANGSAADKTDSSKMNDTKTDDKQEETDQATLDYYAKIKSLNESVSKWIKTHVEADPVCDLTPVFKDYSDHLKKIEEEKDKASKGSPKTDGKPPSTNCTAALGNFKFGGDSTLNESSVKKGFSFGSTADASAVKSQFSFGSGSAVTSTQKADSDTKIASPEKPAAPATSLFSAFTGGSSGFSFGASQPFSFANVAPPKKDVVETAGDAEKEDEEPPKNEFVPVVEENSIYEQRCKVFIKQASDYSDRGVGKLYLKKIDDSDKIQLIVRADTNLGNILLNLILTSGLPASRMGKNNVMLVCIPTPDAKPPPVSVLLRVKTGDDADKLLAEIQKHI